MAPNIAYMILAHHQPRQLARLVHRLNQPNAWFFIHIDKKSPAEVTNTLQQLLKTTNKVVIMNQHDVNWMGYTTIEAELSLMQAAVDTGVPFKYYVLMSGQDYPIKSNNYINEFFASHTEDFLSYNKMAYMGQIYVDKHTLYHFRDIPYLNPRNPKRIPALVYLYFGLHRKVARLFPRKFYNGMELYFGSQWFALTHHTVQYILSFVKNNEGYVRSMKNSDGPDENFFQTIIMNSERRNNVFGYEQFEKWLQTRKEGEQFYAEYSSLRYMDWSERAKTKPAVLDMTYWDDLKNSPDLFARKVDEKASAELLNNLDKNILMFAE